MILLDPSAHPVIAHRGVSGFPENTLGGFNAALQMGADALEMDVRLSADGIPVIMHDASVDRTTDGAGAVSELTAADCSALDAGHGEPVPTLEQALEHFPQTPFLVDLKTRSCVLPVAELLLRTGAADRAVVASFSHGTLARVPPSIRRGASRFETAIAWALSRVHARAPGRYGAFTVPEHYRRFHVVDDRFLRVMTRRRVPVHVWTVDDPARATRLWEAGVAGIVTNRPDRILAAREHLLGRRVAPDRSPSDIT